MKNVSKKKNKVTIIKEDNVKLPENIADYVVLKEGAKIDATYDSKTGVITFAKPLK